MKEKVNMTPEEHFAKIGPRIIPRLANERQGVVIREETTKEISNAMTEARQKAFKEAEQQFTKKFHLQYGGTGKPMRDYIDWLKNKAN